MKSNPGTSNSKNKNRADVVSGTRKTLPGIAYQLKLLMLYLHRGLHKNYNFKLSSEIEAAEKFDDIVFEFESKKGNTRIHRFLQAKHTRDDSKMITLAGLKNVNKGDYGLRKYFISYIKIKQRFDPAKSNDIKEFFICTNINFHPEVKRLLIEIDPCDDVMAFENKENGGYIGKLYKLQINKGHALYKILQSASDVSILAEKLANLINNDEKIKCEGIIKTYQKPLIEQIIDVEKSSLREQIDPTTPFAKKFLALVDQQKRNALKLFSNFGQVNECSKEHLPEDEIDDKQISDFLQKLTFAVDQPNEYNLGQIINKEIGDILNLIEPDLVTDCFLRKILDWSQKKHNTELTAETGKKLFDGILDKFQSLVFAGSNANLAETYKSYRIKFAEGDNVLAQFLGGSKRILNYTCSDTFLVSLEIYYNIENHHLYKYKDSRIFISIEYLKFPNFNQLAGIRDFFKREGTYNLLIVDLVDLQNNFKQLLEIFYEVLMNDKYCKKKIIIISPTSVGCPPQLRDHHTIWPKDIQFTDLHSTTQEKLKRREISFQGSRPTIRKLVGKNTDFYKRINGPSLKKLIKETITIGDQSPVFKEPDSGSYIDRHFKQIEIKNEIFQINLFPDSIIVGIDDTSSHLNNKNSSVEIVNGNDFGKSRYLELKKDRSVHWLKLEKNHIIWQQSNGSISNLIKFLTDRSITTPDTDLLKENNNFFIISDVAGMGKTTVLSKMAYEIKQSDRWDWIVRIDLNQCQKLLTNNSNKRFNNRDDILNFVCNDILKLNEKLQIEGDLFRASFNGEVPICMYFFIDGFDEISPTFEPIVTRFLRALQETKVAKIVVTTRPHEEASLEEKLGVLSHTLVPFAKEDQGKYLNNYWKKNLEITDGDKSERLQTYITSIIKNVSLSVNGKEIQFIGIPQHVNMIAQIFQNRIDQIHEWQSCEEFIKSDNIHPNLSVHLGFLQLYDLFKQKKEYVYITNKSGDDSSSNNVSVGLRQVLKEASKYSQLLALKIFFSDDEICDLVGSQWSQKDIDKDMQTQILRIGFVRRLGNDKTLPEFTHLTYAEYFASTYLIGALDDPTEPVNKIVFTKVLTEEKFNIIRVFLNSYMSPSNVGNSRGSYLARYWREDRRSVCNDKSRNVLHIAAEEGNLNLIHFILKDIENDEDTAKLITEHMDEDGQTALCGAAKSGSLDIFKLLFSYSRSSIESTNKYSSSLYIAARLRHWKVVKWLLGEGLVIDSKNINVKRAFYFAAISGEEEVVKLFVESKYLNHNYVQNSDLLPKVIKHGRLNVLKLLYENKYVAKDEEDKFATLLYAAFEHGRTDIAEWLSRSDLLSIEKLEQIGKHIFEEFKDVDKLALQKADDEIIQHNNY